MSDLEDNIMEEWEKLDETKKANNSRDRNYRKFKAQLDRDYARILEEFGRDNTQTDLKKLRKLGNQAQHLIHRYRAIRDHQGEEETAILYQSIDETVQNLVPVRKSWKRKRFLIGTVAFAAFVGYTKGDLLRRIADPKPPISGIEIALDPSEVDEYPDITFSKKLMPENLVKAYDEFPGSRYGIYFDFSSGGLLYDFTSRTTVTEFDFMGSRTKTPKGIFEIKDIHAGADSRPLFGSAYFELKKFVVAGTYSELGHELIDNGIHDSYKNIFLKDSVMVDLYHRIRRYEHRTIVVVN